MTRMCGCHRLGAHDAADFRRDRPAGQISRVPAADGKVADTGRPGEPSRSCAGGTSSGITSGGVGWITLTLRPSRYALSCDLPIGTPTGCTNSRSSIEWEPSRRGQCKPSFSVEPLNP
jgi:hypothetical protein